MISSQDSPVQVNYNNNTINGNVVQANNLISKRDMRVIQRYSNRYSKVANTTSGLESYQFSINGETINVEIFRKWINNTQ